jgi:hypothetical protein
VKGQQARTRGRVTDEGLYDHVAVTKLVQDLAGLDNARIDDAIVDIQAVAAGLNQAIMAQECEMLGKVRLGKLGDLEKLVYAGLAPFQDIEHLQTLGIGENLVYIGIFSICLLGKW